MIVMTRKGTFKRSRLWLKRLFDMDIRSALNDCGRQGVEALASATPKRTGKTAASWYYTVDKTKTGWAITWYNSNINEGVPIAVIIQYGHGTGSGAYVEGVDYINPAIRPVFEHMCDSIWREVKR